MAEARTYCRICEAACGLVAHVEGGELVRLTPDRDHPVSRGYACVKGPAMAFVHKDPDRLARPERRVGASWRAIEWDEATAQVGKELRRIRRAYGRDSVAVYIGNPTAFSYALAIYGTGFLAGLGTRNFFNASSLDCQNKFAAAERMFGSYAIQPIPDLDRTDFFLCFGSNPLVSQMSFVSAPWPLERLKKILARGGRVALVNPRRTETALALPGAEQIFIRPDTDVFVLMAMLRVILDEDRACRAALAHLAGIEALREAARRFSVEEAALASGVSAETIVELARSFAAAPRATAYCSTGVNQGSAGTLAFFAVQALNALTGRIDAEGGARVPSRALTLARLVRHLDRIRPPRPSRIGNFPTVAASLPTGLLADEILTPGEGQVRALVVIAGNPLLSAPGGERLARALSSLDLLVSIDLYRNETAALAHYTLPATDFLEREDLPLAQAGMQLEPYSQLAPGVVAPRDQRRSEARILVDLARASGVRMFRLPGANAVLRRVASARRDPLIAPLLCKLLGLPVQESRRPGGVRLPDEPPGAFLRAVPTADGKIQLGSPEILAAAPREAERMRREAAAPPALRLIGRRQRRSHNSWFHNVPALRPDGDECRLSIHPLDAAPRRIADGAEVSLRSAHGRITVIALLDENVMPGTVSLPHGWGHSPESGWRVAARAGETGANSNRLAGDGPAALEPLSGMARYNGIDVEVSPA